MLFLSCGSRNIWSFYQGSSKSCGSFNFRACNCCRCLRCIMSFPWANFWLQPLDGSMPAHAHVVLLCFTSGVLWASLDFALQGFSDNWQAWEQGLMMLGQPSTRGVQEPPFCPYDPVLGDILFASQRSGTYSGDIDVTASQRSFLFFYLLLSPLLHSCFLESPLR